MPGAPALVSLFTALGASPVSMQFGEVYTSLQTRIVDGQENPLSVIDAGKVLRSAEILRHHQPRLGRLLDLRQSRFLEPAAERHQGDRRAFNEAALLERDDLAKLDVAAGRARKEGLVFTAETHSFRDKLRTAGFYKEWRDKVGNEAWTLLEKNVGKLG